MANEEEQRASYPRIPAKIWWQLRAAATRSPPKEITSSYLEPLLDLSEGTALNIINNLRVIGLIGSDHKTLPLLHEWRDDETYAKACKAMLERVYPEEIRHVAPPPTPDRAQAVRWFARKTKTGDGASSQMAAFYMLLARGDPKEGRANENGDTPKVKSKPAPKNGNPKARPVRAEEPRELDVNPPKQRTPSMHIDVQIHISPQASTEQIDAIFASMARHLYRDSP